MTNPGFGIFRSLCAMLAALMLFVSSPAAAAFGDCGPGEASCAASCDGPGCDVPLNGGDEGSKGCVHCAYTHVGHSLPAPSATPGAGPVIAANSLYFRHSPPPLNAAPRDGPERPPQA